MPIVNDTNFPNGVPSESDYAPWIRDSDGEAFTATMTQYATLFQSLASLINSVTIYSSTQTLTDEQFVEANSGAALTFNLPASSLNTGRAYRIFNKGAGVLTIDAAGTDTINGAATLALAQYQSAIVQSDGVGAWAAFGAP